MGGRRTMSGPQFSRGFFGAIGFVQFLLLVVAFFTLLAWFLGTGAPAQSPAAPPPNPSGLREIDRPSCTFAGMLTPAGQRMIGRMQDYGIDRDGGHSFLCSWSAKYCYASWKVECVTLETTVGSKVDALQYVPPTLTYEAKYTASPDPEVDPTFNCHGFTFAKTLGSYWINDPAQILADLYSPITNESERRAGDVVVYRANGSYVHSGVLEALNADPHNDTIENKGGKNPNVRFQLRGPGSGTQYAWEDDAQVLYYRRRTDR